MPELQVEKLYKTAEETVKPEIAQINGSLPKWLSGQYLRIGPGKFDFPNGVSMKHILDGYSILSKVTIEGDFIKFEKKYLQSDSYKRAVAAGKPVITEFGTRAQKDPNKSLFSRIISAVLPIELSDNCQLLFPMGKDVFATSDSSYFRQISPGTLETGDKFDTNKCFGVNISTAQPLTDEKGDVYNIGCSVLSGLKAHVIKIPAGASNTSTKDMLKKSKIICTIPSRWAGLLSYNHSFAMTKDYIIYISQPYVMNIAKAAMTYLKNPPFKEWLEWRGEEFQNRFYIIEKETGKLLKTEFLSGSSFFFLNVINSYQMDDQIVIDINTYEDASIFEELWIDKLRQGGVQKCQAKGQRFVIPIIETISNAPQNVNLVSIKSEATATSNGQMITLSPELLSKEGLEMPTINKKFCGKKYNYYYGPSILQATSPEYANSIVKIDTKRKESMIWRESQYYYPNSIVFVANPGGKGEDDGIIISSVTDIRSNCNDFIVFLNAKDMTVLAKSYFKCDIPQSFNSIFLSDS